MSSRLCGQGEDIVGLSLLHRGHIVEVDGSTVELTDDVARELTVLPLSAAVASSGVAKEDMESVKTLWTFGSREGEDTCHHCHHCTHAK